MLIARVLLVHLPVLRGEISIAVPYSKRFAAGSIRIPNRLPTQEAWRSLATLICSNVKGRPIGGLSTFCC